MSIAKKIIPAEQTKIPEFYNGLETFYKITRNLAREVEGLILEVPNLYTSPQGRAIRKSAYSVFTDITEAYSFRKKQDTVLHCLKQAYSSSVKTVAYLSQEKYFGRLRRREVFKAVIRKYSEFQKELFDFVKSIDEKFAEEMEEIK